MEYKVIKEKLLEAEKKHVKNLTELKSKYDKDVENFINVFVDNVYGVIKEFDMAEFETLLSDCMKDEDISRGMVLALMSCAYKVGDKND